MNNRRLSLAIQIGFLASVILNAFLAGVIVSGPFFHGPPPGPARHLYDAARDLPPDTRAKVEGILDRRSSEIDAAMRGGGRGFKEMEDALTAPSLDPAAIDRAAVHLADHHIKVGALIGGMFKELALAIPDAETRRAFFRRALPPLPGPPRGF